MSSITVFDAETHFGELLERVANGEEIVITRHNKPVARLIPEGIERQEDVREALAGLAELRERIRQRSPAPISDHEVRAAIEAGRH